MIAKAAGLKSPPQLSELLRAIVRWYRFRAKKNDNSVVLVQDEPEDGGLGDGVASGRVFYSRSFQEEWNFVLLMGKDLTRMDATLSLWMGIESSEQSVSTYVAKRGWELISTADFADRHQVAEGAGNLHQPLDLADRHQVDGRWDAGVSVYTRQLRACSRQSCAKSFYISTCDDLISNPRSTPPSSRANTTLMLYTINTMTRLQWKPLFRISLPFIGSCNSSTYW